MKSKNEVKFTALLEAYKKAYAKDHYLTLSSFCRSEGEDCGKFQHWLNRSGQSVTQIKNEILFAQNEIAKMPDKIPPGEKYLNVWTKFKEHLAAGNNVSLRSFCILHDVEYGKMDKWMSRNNFSVTDLKKRLGMYNQSDNNDDENFTTPEVKRRLASVLKKYKKRLLVDPGATLFSFCSEQRVDYALMQKMLQYLGISVKQLKQAAMLEDKCPKRCRNVFVQFKPNGGSGSDTLTGVKIQLADGSNILVEECTVISLCAFINKYDNDQRRKERYDV